MKKFIVKVFRNSPACTGLISLLIALHLVGIKDLRTPLSSMPADLFLTVFGLYCFAMLVYMLFILPHIAQEKREKRTWAFVGLSVLTIVIFAKFLAM